VVVGAFASLIDTVINDLRLYVEGVINMKCSACAMTELIHDTRNIPHNYKGDATLILVISGDFYPACDESILDAEQFRCVMGIMLG
jgi:YgiT-type zinc finger domain-containing protein